MAIVGYPHPVDLPLRHRKDRVVGGQCDEPVVRAQQEGNSVVGEQRGRFALTSPARCEDVKVVTKPSVDFGCIHDHEQYRRDDRIATVCVAAAFSPADPVTSRARQAAI